VFIKSVGCRANFSDILSGAKFETDADLDGLFSPLRRAIGVANR